MTKQEKIKEAYGSRYISLKESINCNGWINQNVTTRALFDSLEFDEKINSMRPLELKGIENNNGWIKIESNGDLPIDEDECFVICEKSQPFFINSSKIILGHHTHYQPIIKPQPPIY